MGIQKAREQHMARRGCEIRGHFQNTGNVEKRKHVVLAADKLKIPSETNLDGTGPGRRDETAGRRITVAKRRLREKQGDWWYRRLSGEMAGGVVKSLAKGGEKKNRKS